MEYNYYNICYPDYLMHYGVKGMKWGRRKARSIIDTSGRRFPGQVLGGPVKENQRLPGQVLGGPKKNKLPGTVASADAKRNQKIAKTESEIANKEARNTPEAKAARKAKVAKAAKIGAAVAGTALAAYGAYKTAQFVKDKHISIQRDRGKAAAEDFLNNHKYTSSTWGFGRDDSVLVTAKTKSGNVMNLGEKVTGHGAEYANNVAKARQKSYDALQSINNKAERDAAAIRKSYIDNAKNDSFRTAAKNVYDDYRKNRKR